MKYLTNAIVAITAILAIASLSGCGGEPVKPSAENARATAALGALEKIREAYVGRDMQGVLDRVSTTLEGGYSGFSARVRKDMDLYEKVELKLFVERVELADDTASVVFHWHGNWWDREGKRSEGRGNSIFKFAGEADPKIIGVIGDQPFGIVW